MRGCKEKWRSYMLSAGEVILFAGWTWRISRVHENTVYGIPLDQPGSCPAVEQAMFKQLYEGVPIERTGYMESHMEKSSKASKEAKGTDVITTKKGKKNDG